MTELRARAAVLGKMASISEDASYYNGFCPSRSSMAH